MEKIILSRENIEKNRDEILAAYAASTKKSSKLPLQRSFKTQQQAPHPHKEAEKASRYGQGSGSRNG